MTGTVDIQELRGRAIWLKDYGVKTMICDPSTIFALIEVVKRQGDALEKIAKGKYGKCPVEGHWPPEKPCTLCGDLGFFDDEPQYNPAKDGHCVEGGARIIARAALKETTDV